MNYYDGVFTSVTQEGPIRTWQDVFTRSRLYAQKVRILAANWAALAISNGGPNGGFLVEESQPRVAGGSILEWERTFADVPATFSRAEMLAYPLQLIITSSSSSSYSQSLAEIPINTPVQAVYSYKLTTTPWDGVTIPIVRKYTIVSVGPLFYEYGTPITPPATMIQGADTVISQWRGDIYQAKNLLISIPALTPHA
jgi:hypothetical protein